MEEEIVKPDSIEEKKLDIRVMRLAKFHVPQELPFTEYGYDKITGSFEYASLGHFKLLDVKKINRSALYDVFTETSKETNSRCNNSYSCLSEQIVYLFRNEETEECDSESFWESDKPILFCSMIHIKNFSEKLSDIRRNITQEIINKTGKKPLIYYTFDYSDLVIFFKDYCFSNYLYAVSDIFYFDENIGDSYTVYSLNMKFLKKFEAEDFNVKEFNKAAKVSILNKKTNYDENVQKMITEENLYISINIGTAKFSVLKYIKERIDERFKGDSNLIYLMFGRQDISVINQKGDLMWLVNMLSFLNEIIDDDGNAIITYESFIKNDLTEKFLNQSNPVFDDTPSLDYSNVNDLCFYLIHELNKSTLLSRLIPPIYNVNRSISSISRNGFAQEFVLCVLEAYIKFIITIKDIIKNDENLSDYRIEHNVSEIITEFYLTLNTQINGMMHSERQFIQATSFNAIYYDIPPKMMAYYTAYSHKIAEIMRDENESNYTCVFTPYFDDGISVENITIHREPPTDRVLSININESTLFNVFSVQKSLSHEIAHYAGEKMRNRVDRRNKIIKLALLKIIITVFEFPITDELSACVNNIYCALINHDSISDDSMLYMEKIKKYLIELYSVFIEKIRIFSDEEYESDPKNLSNNYVYKIFYDSINEYLKSEFSLVRQMPDSDKNDYYEIINMYESIERNYFSDRYLLEGKRKTEDEEKDRFDFISGELFKEKYRSYINSITAADVSEITTVFFYDNIEPIASIFSETFADLQSVMVQGISYTEYLHSFLYDERLDVEQIGNKNNTTLRFAALKYTLFNAGVWNVEKCDDENVNRLAEYINICINGNPLRINNDKYVRIQEKYSRSKIKFDETYMFSEEKHHEIITFPGVSGFDAFAYVIFKSLSDYIANCLDSILDFYSKDEKAEAINKIRKSNAVLKQFNNMDAVFKMLNIELSEYNDYLAGLCKNLNF